MMNIICDYIMLNFSLNYVYLIKAIGAQRTIIIININILISSPS